MDRIDRIIEALTVSIPDPMRPPPKPQKSWANLRPGDVISPAQAAADPSSSTFTVVSCDSQGALLSDGSRLEDRDWAQQWTKLAKKRRTK